MLERANKRLVELNELMVHHMTSPDDAFRMVSTLNNKFIIFSLILHALAE